MRKSMNAKVTSNVGDSFSNIYLLFYNLVVLAWDVTKFKILPQFMAKPEEIKNYWVSSEV